MREPSRNVESYSHARLVLLCREQEKRLRKVERRATEPVAIVGMACRFPGADTPRAYWRLLQEGIDAVTEIPPDRWNASEFWDETPGTPGKMYCRYGAFLDEDVHRFDPKFFNMSPREAASVDPQHRLLLELTWEALEDAGVDPRALRGSSTGVFIGFSADDYAKNQLLGLPPEQVEVYTGIGGAYCYGAGRIAHNFGFLGPTLALDTACSSSLVALHLACASLRASESTAAIVGGVHLWLSPVAGLFLSQARALAPDGRCKTFDARADGYVRGEGAAVVVLKLLSAALADGDPIHAVIRGSAINHDGPAAALTVPNGPAQQAVLAAALRSAKLEPGDISYVEAHGTGTALGDPIEIRALARVFGRAAGRGSERPLVLGSVKTNIGHLEGAAGMAGLLKTVLALEHETIPPHLHFERANPEIRLDDGPFMISREGVPWRRGAEARFAGISSFGMSGTNAHVIVGERPALEGKTTDSAQAAALHLLTLRAKSEPALHELAERFERHLAGVPPAALGDVCHTANVGRSDFAHRLAIVAADVTEMRAKLGRFQAGESAPGLIHGRAHTGASRPKIAFLFTGQGSQCATMGAELYRTQRAYRDALDACAEQLRPYLDRPLLELLHDPDAPLQETGYTQPCLFALEYALAQLWRSWGVVPEAVLGHSVGEYAAAVVASVMSLADAAKLVAARGRLIQSLPTGGAMAAVQASKTSVEPALENLAGEVAIAAVNGPDSVVLSGTVQGLNTVLERLSARGVKGTRLNVSHAFHSPLMDPILDDFERAARPVVFERPSITFVSNLTGREETDLLRTANYWCQHVRESVDFLAGMLALGRLGFDTFVEIGPKSTLAAMGQQFLVDPRYAWFPSMAPGSERRTVLAALGGLYARGVSVDWVKAGQAEHASRVSIPTYPFQRQRHVAELRGAHRSPTVLRERDIPADSALARRVEALLARWGGDGDCAINRRASSPFLFLTPGHRSLFFFNQRDGAVIASSYVGPPEIRVSSVEDLLQYTRSRGLDLTLFADEAAVGALHRSGFSTTPLGVWQAIEDLRLFSTQGNKAKRVRSKINSYVNSGGGAVAEHVIGRDRVVDAEIVRLMNGWMKRKGRSAPFTGMLGEEILAGSLRAAYRVFLARRGGELECAVILSPIPSKNGYLMDLEFYSSDMRPGCLEFTITSIMERLRAEGALYFSLGSTFGTQLWSHAHADPEVTELLQSLRNRGILSSDGNFEFKKKFDPNLIQRFYLCRPRGSGSEAVATVLSMLVEAGSDADVVANSSAIPSGARVPQQASAIQSASSAIDRGARHPLLGQQLLLSLPESVFHNVVDPAHREVGFLLDHKVYGRPLLPGAAYLENVIAGQRALAVDGTLVLRDVLLQAPLFLAIDEPRSVQTVFGPKGERGRSFSVKSAPALPGTDDPWVVHASGEVEAPRATEVPAVVDFDALRQRVATPVRVDEFYRNVGEIGIEYGPAFRCIEELYVAGGEALARVRLPRGVAAEEHVFSLHPAQLDACLQFAGVAFLNLRGTRADVGNYLPVMIEELRVHDTSAEELWSHARIRPPSTPAPDTLTTDITVLRASGEVVVELQGLLSKRVTKTLMQTVVRRDVAEPIWEMRWQALAKSGVKNGSGTGVNLILADQGGVGRALAAKLEEGGEQSLLVSVDDATDQPARVELAEQVQRAIRRAIELNAGKLQRVVHLWACDGSERGLSMGAIERAQALGCASVLSAVKTLAKETEEAPKVWLVTRGSQPVYGEAIDPSQASVWGLGRSLAHELPEMWGGLIDLESTPSADEAAMIHGEIVSPDEEDHVAFRGGRRHVARLSRYHGSQNTPLGFDADASYLITGGVGGLGFAVASWLVDKGARHVALMGRSATQREADDRVVQLRARAANVLLVDADVAERHDVERALERIAASMPPLKGVLHAAGVLADGVLLDLDWPAFEKVFAPKVRGLLNLHDCTRELPLDHFVMFSSMASLIGAAGQGNYAAANAFMDAFAHYRRSQALPALSVNWGPWSDVGMAAALGREAQARSASRGIGTLDPDEACGLLERLMLGDVAQVGVMPVDWDVLASTVESLGRSLARDLLGRKKRATNAQRSRILEAIVARPASARQTALADYLSDITGRVLNLAPSEVDRDGPLIEMGFDSLMAVELRQCIKRELELDLPLARVFRGDTLTDFAVWMAAELLKRDGAPDHAKVADSEVASIPDLQLSSSLVDRGTPLTVHLAPIAGERESGVELPFRLDLLDSQGRALAPIAEGSFGSLGYEASVDTAALEDGLYIVDYQLGGPAEKTSSQLWRRFAVCEGVAGRLQALRADYRHLIEGGAESGAALAAVSNVVESLTEAQARYLCRVGDADPPAQAQANGAHRRLDVRLPFEPGEDLALAEALCRDLHRGVDPFAHRTGRMRLLARSSRDQWLLPFELYVPERIDPSRRMPLVLALHGILCDERFFLDVNDGQCRELAERYGFLVVAPAARGTNGSHTEASEQDILDVISAVEATHRVDVRRVYVTGHSMGSEWAWRIALRSPDAFAGLAAISGVATPEEMSGLLARSRSLPVRQFHGAEDGLSPVDVARGIAARASEQLDDYEYTEYAECGHLDVLKLALPRAFEFFERVGSARAAGTGGRAPESPFLGGDTP